ncbi:MAG: exodeoxyribonuclease VII large subunit [Anaerolineales bacterium]
MSQPSLFASVTWTVSRLTQHIRTLLESDVTLQDVWVQGEISNLGRPASGHIYFTLKDAGASLRGVMWKGDARRLTLPLQDGMEIEAHGRIGVYEPQGQYQFYADIIRPVGEGALYQEFLRLKARLETEGLFDAERKRPIPDLPHKIGIVTSATGAALRDMLNTLRRRLPLAEVILAPSPVQGDEAPPSLVAALDSLAQLEPDVILLARGGGSIEDLWAFNDERVVRAVAACDVPVISGVGHETDFTLCDFAADLRAPTPTAAAELATPITLIDLSAYLQGMNTRLVASTLNLLTAQRSELTASASRLRFVSPLRRIQTDRQRLDDFARRGISALKHRVALDRSRLQGFERRLEALNPLAVLGRGYAVVSRQADGKLVSQVGQVKSGDRLRVRVSDGEFGATVSQEKES